MEQDAVALIVAHLRDRREALPAGGADWLGTHPRAAERLLRAVMGMYADQYLRWEYRVSTTVWAVDAEDVERIVTQPAPTEHIRLQLRWTGRWRVDTLSPDTWVFLHGTDPPSHR